MGHCGPIQLRTDFWGSVSLRDHYPAHPPESPEELFLSQILVGAGVLGISEQILHCGTDHVAA